jgi:nicotinamidase-related amidase
MAAEIDLGNGALKTAMLVIDVQNGIYSDDADSVDFFPNPKDFRANLTALVGWARTAGVPVMYVAQTDESGEAGEAGRSAGGRLVEGSEAWQICDWIAPAEGEMIFEKRLNSALHGEEGDALHKNLLRLAVRQLIITGIATQYCVTATVESAFDFGYSIFVPRDCNAAKSVPVARPVARGEAGAAGGGKHSVSSLGAPIPAPTIHALFNDDILPCFSKVVKSEELLAASLKSS